MALDGITVDIQGLGRLDDISLIYDEPMEEVMTFQVMGE